MENRLWNRGTLTLERVLFISCLASVLLSLLRHSLVVASSLVVTPHSLNLASKNTNDADGRLHVWKRIGMQVDEMSVVLLFKRFL